MDMQPGQIQVPHDDLGSNQPQQPTTNTYTPPQPLQSFEQPQSVMPAPAPLPQQSVQPSQPNPVSIPDSGLAPQGQGDGWQYNQETDIGTTGPDRLPPEAMNWTAAEFIEHPKGVAWYGVLALVGLGLAVADFSITKDVISTSVIVFAAAMFGVYAAHKPRTQQYQLNSHGLQIGEKMYNFEAFKNFSVVEEGVNISIVFMPLKRFAPPLTIYVSMDIEERVLDYLSFFLPFEQRPADVIDGLLRRIRF